MSYATLDGANLEGVHLVGGKAHSTSFKYAKLFKAEMEDLDSDRADFRGALETSSRLRETSD